MEEPSEEKKPLKTIPLEQEFENFRMYHQLQYDRIDKLESKRETFSNLVVTISAGIYLFGFGNVSNLNQITGILLPIIIIIVNISSIIFADKSRFFIKMHQNRAKIARAEYAPQLNEISARVKKINSNKDFFRRSRIYKYLHISLIIIALLAIWNFHKNEQIVVNSEKANEIEQVNEKKIDIVVPDSLK